MRGSAAHAAQPCGPTCRSCSWTRCHHFAETYAYRDEIAARWNLNLVNAAGRRAAAGTLAAEHQACCARHKVEPLFRALAGYDMWFTGLRREQSPSRAESAGSRALRTAERQDRCARSARLPTWTTNARSGLTPRRTIFRCCRCTTRATPASDASPARRCRCDPDERSVRTMGRAEAGVRDSHTTCDSRRAEDQFQCEDRSASSSDWARRSSRRSRPRFSRGRRAGRKLELRPHLLERPHHLLHGARHAIQPQVHPAGLAHQLLPGNPRAEQLARPHLAATA